ncbi:structural maintenance of chromosomes protein 4 isoform X3 [Vidua chalybeata]|uniref:structural maintenance of chromosomes protein 4 isoform X3 n=1 Tax=Vidua chalybeata TaxID=81927 RepID=UPI0023A86FDA|nr:structural maintenance of chromosomes protein 4 isoform X3 [Vidua chalybeata]
MAGGGGGAVQTRGPGPSRPSLPRAFLTNFGSSSPFRRHFRVWKRPSFYSSRSRPRCRRLAGARSRRDEQHHGGFQGAKSLPWTCPQELAAGDRALQLFDCLEWKGSSQQGPCQARAPKPPLQPVGRAGSPWRSPPWPWKWKMKAPGSLTKNLPKRFSCIIGPNGSGKSNIIDSLLFVFGYRAQKIRSKKLSVLIHNSDEHKDIQSCSVEVHFQKITDKEGDDYEVIPDSKFYVSRTAYRDNSSTYYINGKKKTFRDVGMLLRSHGIDLDHNRFLILQLNRVKMVEKEKDALEQDKNKAIEFLCLENQIFKEKNQMCQYYIHDLKKRINDLEMQKEKINEETKSINEKSSKLAEETKTKNKALKDLEKKFNKITKFIEENKEKFTQLDLQDVKVRENLKHTKSKAKKLEKQLQKDKEKVEELKNVPSTSAKAIEEATAKRDLLAKAKDKEEAKLRQVLASLQEETKGIQKEKEGKEKELMEFSKEVTEARSNMELAQSELELYLSKYNSALAWLSQAQEALGSTSNTLKERKAAVRDIAEKLPQAEQQLREKENALEKLGKEESGAKDLVRNLRRKVEEAKSSLAQSRCRGKVLEALLQQKKCGNIPGLYGRLGDLGAIDDKYDVAISSSCGALDHIVVDTIDTAQACVNFLKAGGIGVATFIALDKMAVWEKKMQEIPTPENAPRLFDLVKVEDPKVRLAFYFALRDTLVAKNLEEATRIAFQKQKRWRVVTLQGQIIEVSGTMTGGGGKVMKGRMGSSVVMDISEEEISKMESQLQRDSKRAVQCEEEKSQLEEAIRKLQQDIREMRNTSEKYTASIQGFSEQEIDLKNQIKELEAKVAAAAPDKTKQKELEKVLDGYKKDYERVAEQARKMEEEVKRLHQLIMDTNNQKLKAQQDKIDKIDKEMDECSSAITKAQVAAKTADRNLKKSEEALQRTEKEMEENEKEMKNLTAELTTLEDKATEVMNECRQAEEALPAVQEEQKNLLQEMKTIRDAEHALQSEALSIKLKIEQIDSHISTHQGKVKYWQKEISKLALHAIEGEAPEELRVLSQEELEALQDPDVLSKKIALLEAQRHQLRPNLSAIAEYRSKEELYLKHVDELDNITSERDKFREAFEELRKQRLNEFMAGFNVITNKLKENYQMLTLGGDAELELVDSLDPFSEGIMFSVRPPKKSWKKIFNLSGGEKTLSSLALVFALHHYKPTPLYFMDEIDAALDFKNVSIVAFYIYEQTKNAQFIIISLRNNMFEIADRLIGIYKTQNTTKSVATNPKILAVKGLEELGLPACSVAQR